MCLSAVDYAEKCCRDEEGNQWPPIPTDVPRDSYTIHELQRSDVPNLDDLELDRGMDFREGHYAPFPVHSWEPNIVVCARWDRSTDEGALREWLDHHRCTSTPSKHPATSQRLDFRDTQFCVPAIIVTAFFLPAPSVCLKIGATYLCDVAEADECTFLH